MRTMTFLFAGLFAAALWSQDPAPTPAPQPPPPSPVPAAPPATNLAPIVKTVTSPTGSATITVAGTLTTPAPAASSTPAAEAGLASTTIAPIAPVAGLSTVAGTAPAAAAPIEEPVEPASADEACDPVQQLVDAVNAESMVREATEASGPADAAALKKAVLALRQTWVPESADSIRVVVDDRLLTVQRSGKTWSAEINRDRAMVADAKAAQENATKNVADVAGELARDVRARFRGWCGHKRTEVRDRAREVVTYHDRQPAPVARAQARSPQAAEAAEALARAKAGERAAREAQLGDQVNALKERLVEVQRAEAAQNLAHAHGAELQKVESELRAEQAKLHRAQAELYESVATEAARVADARIQETLDSNFVKRYQDVFQNAKTEKELKAWSDLQKPTEKEWANFNRNPFWTQQVITTPDGEEKDPAKRLEELKAQRHALDRAIEEASRAVLREKARHLEEEATKRRAEADRQAKEARERATEARQSANAARPAFRGFQRSTETRPSGGFGTAFGVGPGTPPPAHLPARSDARLESNDAEIKELREELDRLRREVEDLRRVATRQER